MAGQKFQKICEKCKTSIDMVKTPNGWTAFDSFGKHFCLPFSKKSNSSSWSLKTLDHPFTCKTTCWWCGDDRVFFHTNGNRDAVLLEEPFGVPWIIHPCWENNKEDRTNRLSSFETGLKEKGYNGKDEKFNDNAYPNSKIILQFKAEDYRVLDNAIQEICNLLSTLKIYYIGPLPYKYNNKFIRKLNFNESVFNHISSRLPMDLPPSIDIQIY